MNTTPSSFIKTLSSGMEYIYLGDRLTSDRYAHAHCKAVRRSDGKCIRGKTGSMLVEFDKGERVVVIGRRLRRLPA